MSQTNMKESKLTNRLFATTFKFEETVLQAIDNGIGKFKNLSCADAHKLLDFIGEVSSSIQHCDLHKKKITGVRSIYMKKKFALLDKKLQELLPKIIIQFFE